MVTHGNKHLMSIYVDDDIFEFFEKERNRVSLSSYVGGLLWAYMDEVKKEEQNKGANENREMISA